MPPCKEFRGWDDKHKDNKFNLWGKTTNHDTDLESS